MRFDIGFRALPKTHRFGVGEPSGDPGRMPGGERVDAIELKPALRHAARSGIGEANLGKGTEPHVVRLAVEHVPEHPAFRPAGADPQIEPSTIGQELRAPRIARRRFRHL